MAGSATDSSRMGITLQGYDQVIALSQANINETLRRYFTALDEKDELVNFKAKVNLESINAPLLPPTIELIDKDAADGALYIVHLGEGFYSTWIEGEDEEPEKVKLPTNGWELAFDVDFAFKPLKEVPESIKRQVPLPGGYSVNQLLINFGDFTRVLQLNGKRSKYPIAAETQKKVSMAKIESALELFLRTYLKEQLVKKDSHNLLGSVVKVETVPSGQAATFIPTESKVQIIGHRPNGTTESFRQDAFYNAFCFTEMTEKRTMPSKELAYSGNWFYESIGGTLDISRGRFWDSFMIAKIKNAHVKAVQVGNQILDKIASDKFEGKSGVRFDNKPWCLDATTPTRDGCCRIYQGSESWSNLSYTTSYKCSELEHWNKDDSVFINWFYRPRCTVHTLARPEPGKGQIVVRQDIEIRFEEGGELSGWFNFNIVTALARKSFNLFIKGGLKLTLVTTIDLKSILKTGELQVDSHTETTRKDIEPMNVDIGGLGSWFPDAAKKIVNDWSAKLDENYRKAREEIGNHIGDLETLFNNVTTELKQDLNQQNKFVFPGNGVFDMKDPLFTNNGDLMVGLTYRKVT